jgi:hypothetical protein
MPTFGDEQGRDKLRSLPRFGVSAGLESVEEFYGGVVVLA